MINTFTIPPSLAAALSRYRSKIIDASIVGHSTRARVLRLEAAGAIMQANLKEEGSLCEQAALFKKNYIEALQHEEQEKAKEWLLAAYAVYQLLIYGPSIHDAANKAMEQRVLLASQLIKNPQEQDCREQAVFHAENVVDYLLRANEAQYAKNHFLLNCWNEVAQGAREASLLWIKAANSLCSYSFFGLIPFVRIEVVRHAENKNKRKLLRIASYFSTLLAQQQWKDPLAEKAFCQKKILLATSIGNLSLALCWRLVEQEIDDFLEHSKNISLANIEKQWSAFVVKNNSPLHAFLYGVFNSAVLIPAASWVFATDARLEPAAHYRYWIVRSKLLCFHQTSHELSFLELSSCVKEPNDCSEKIVPDKKSQQDLLSTLMQKISFCLPEECMPDRACEQAWKEGKLVPRIEFTMFYSWIYQSWKRLQQADITCSLSKQLLEPGVTVTLGNYLITSLGLDAMIPKETFLVDVTADRAPHPGAQLHVVENKMQARLLPHAIFIPHWPQSGLIPRDPNRGLHFKNVAFFGETKNLAPELRSKEWQQRLAQELGILFYLQGNQGWHDYSNIDAVVAIRSFSSSRYFNKPATKLYNAWHAGVPFIGGRDIAYATDGRPGIDYLVANSPEEVFFHLKQLKENSDLRSSLVQEGSLSAKKFTQEVILEHWKKLIQETIPKHVAAWNKKSQLSRRFFFMRQYAACLFYRS